jgi:hydrogenase maturation protease
MKILVMGIGNLLWADEGFGVRCIECFANRYVFDSDEVELMDGGTQGIYLVNHVKECEYLLVFDAVDYGLAPGTIKVVEGDEVPRFMGVKKISLHQTGFQEVISTAQLLGWEPKGIAMVGVQPEMIEDFGGSLTSIVKAQIEPCLTLGAEFLKQWGATFHERIISESEPSIVHTELDMQMYESNRPDEQDACRLGDERVLESGEFELRDTPLHEGGCHSIPIDGRKLFSQGE